MALSLEEMLARRPVDQSAVDREKERMLAEVRAYRLREVRKACAMTQANLAATIDVSQNRVSLIEKGDIERIQVDTLRRYVEGLGGHLRLEVELGDERFTIA